MGINVLSPDVNASFLNYAAIGDDIRFGLIGVKGIGESGIKAWLLERRESGPAKSFGGYLMRAPGLLAGKGGVGALINAGAFDSFGHTRASLDYVFEDACARATKAKKTAKASVVSLFDDAMDEMTALEVVIPEIPEWSKATLLGRERDVLGLYVSDHPLSGLEGALEVLSSHSVSLLRDSEYPPDGTVKIAGLITSVERKITKKSGEAWAIVTVEDMDSSIPVYVFPRSYKDVEHLLKQDAVLLFTGRAEKKDDGSTSFVVSSVTAPDLAAATRKVTRMAAEALENPGATKAAPKIKEEHVAAGYVDDGNTAPVRLRVLDSQLTEMATGHLKLILQEYRGSRPVVLEISKEDGETLVMGLDDTLRVVGSAQFAAEIRALFGGDAV